MAASRPAGGVASALIRATWQTGPATRGGGLAWHPEEVAQQSPLGTFSPAERVALVEVTPLESVTPTITRSG